MRLGGPALILLQAYWIFAAPMTGAPPARPIERPQKIQLATVAGLRRFPQDEFAFDAQEFGDAQFLLVTLGSSQAPRRLSKVPSVSLVRPRASAISARIGV